MGTAEGTSDPSALESIPTASTAAAIQFSELYLFSGLTSQPPVPCSTFPLPRYATEAAAGVLWPCAPWSDAVLQ